MTKDSTWDHFTSVTVDKLEVEYDLYKDGTFQFSGRNSKTNDHTVHVSRNFNPGSGKVLTMYGSHSIYKGSRSDHTDSYCISNIN